MYDDLFTKIFLDASSFIFSTRFLLGFRASGFPRMRAHRRSHSSTHARRRQTWVDVRTDTAMVCGCGKSRIRRVARGRRVCVSRAWARRFVNRAISDIGRACSCSRANACERTRARWSGRGMRPRTRRCACTATR